MIKKLFMGLMSLIGVAGYCGNPDIRLLDSDSVDFGGKTLPVKYYCKENRVYAHIYGTEGKDGRMILPVVWSDGIRSTREDPQVLCREYKEWLAQAE